LDKQQGAAGITTVALSVCDGPPASAVIQKRYVVSISYKGYKVRRHPWWAGTNRRNPAPMVGRFGGAAKMKDQLSEVKCNDWLSDDDFEQLSGVSDRSYLSKNPVFRPNWLN
jgi:hypothetical protein